MLHRLFVLLAITAIGVLAQSERDWVNQGVRLYKNAQYVEAIEAFQQAVNLNPSGIMAHLYLGTALMTQWIPWAEPAENGEFARKARAEFETVVRLDPSNTVALQSLASLAFNASRSQQDPAEKIGLLDQAAEWNRRLAQANPQAKEAYYSLGVIAWSKFYPALMAAREQLGMRPEDPGPLSSSDSRRDLTARFGSVIEDGLVNLQKALEIDPAYDDAMAYINLLIRERADLRDSAEEYKRDVETADTWVQKALDTRRSKADSPRPELRSAPPPPPPPPPPARSASIESPQRIRVSGNVQESNLVSRVEPTYPPTAREARLQGVVRLQVVIGKDGHVESVQVVSGHPVLVPAGIEAVKQWVYRPTLLNGDPVEVTTVVELNFQLGG